MSDRSTPSQPIDEGARPDRGDGASGVRVRVLQLRTEGTRHLAAVLVAELRGITPEQGAVDVGGPHRYSFRGMSPVARAWLNRSLTRRASARAASRSSCVRR